MGSSLTSPKFNEEEFREYLENEVLTHIFPEPTAEILKSKCRKPRKPRPQSVQQTALTAKPIKGINENKVNPVDGRQQILTTAQWPDSVHGVVAVKFNDVMSWGSGTLIGPNIVLTAGHNLYNYDDQIYADLESMQFLPAINGHNLPFGIVEVEKYLVSPDYVNEKKEDYGLLILKKPIGEMTGYFGLACLDPTVLKTKRINITGYPGDKVASKPKTYEMWGMEGSVSQIDQDSLYYLVDTAEGQSGSGVYYEEDGEYFVCGVHVQGGQTANIGTLITWKGYQQIYRWIQENTTKLYFCLATPYICKLKSSRIDANCILPLFEYNLDDITHLVLSWEKINVEGVKILAQNTSWVNLSQLDLYSNNIGNEGAKAIGQNTSWINLSQLNLRLNKIGDEGAKAIGQNTSWVNLLRLNLSENKIGDEGAQVMGQNTSWINLSQLNLYSNNIGNEGAKAIGQNTSWINLSQLNLSWSNISDEGAKGMGQNTSWINLSQLDLSRNTIGDVGAKAIGQNTSWINLSHLDLSENKISDEGAKGMGQNTSWINLSQLNLSRNTIGDVGAKAIGQNTSWINLSQLNLSWSNISDEGAKGMGQNTSWINLSQLNLSRNTIGDVGAKAIGQNTSWINLSHLDLSVNKISDEGVKAIGQNTSWINLSHLYLSGNKIGDEGAKAIGQNTSWINLSHLYLSGNKIGDEGAKAIGQNPSWMKLSELDLSRNKISDEGAKVIAQNTSWANLFHFKLSFNNIGDDGAQSLAQNVSLTKPFALCLEGNKISDKGAKAFLQLNIKKLNLAWNNMSYEGTRALSKVADSNLDHFEILRNFSHVTSFQIFSIWSAIENSSVFDTLRITFSSHYRSFIMDIIPAKKFEDFVIDISHVVHSRLDFNRSLMYTPEDDEVTEESDFNPDPHLSAFYCYGNRISIEEGLAPPQNNSSLNLNSSNLSVEEVQSPFKNIYINSS